MSHFLFFFSFNRRESIRNSSYICGVVEGFYGRPWTLDQRKHLYKRQNLLGLTTYVYAPKDDIKHRAAWREPYNEEEMSILRFMVDCATDNNVNFVYAISPGLDIRYSSEEEMKTLKKKLEQVQSAGCSSFAVLFDDIEVEMHDEDQRRFQSFAHAQVHVANTIFEHLKPKTFMFCPTEYCESRANPTLESSPYLNTIGENLAKEIHIMWTGPRVISRTLSVEHLARVGQVMRRRPLIWDNLHANDYDLKKVFMGPVKDRSVKIREFSSGLLSNPNGRYEADFVPFHCLSDWNAADRDYDPEKPSVENKELFNIDCNTETVYMPEVSITNAVTTWINEFAYPSGIANPQPPQLTADVAGFVPDRRTAVWLLDLPQTHGIIRPEPVPVEIPSKNIIQSAVPPEEPAPSELNSLAPDYSQPMETDEGIMEDEDESMITVDEDVVGPVVVSDLALSEEDVKQQRIALLTTFVEMFYLPFENGPRVQRLFKEYNWLMQNASVMRNKFQDIETLDPLQSEWLVKYDGVNEFLTNAIDMFFFVTQAINKTILSELTPYAFEVHGSCVVLIAVARWMMQGYSSDIRSDKIVEDCGSTEEKWIHYNGFVTETIRTLTIFENMEIFFNNKIFLPLCMFCFDIRPFTISDQEYISGMVSVMLTNNQELLLHRAASFADRNIIPFLASGAEHNFVCEKEDETGHKPVCYATAHSDGQVFKNHLISHKVQMKEKYKGLIDELMIGSTKLTEEYVEFLQNSQTPLDVEDWYPNVPEHIFEKYPSWVETYFGLDATDTYPMKKVLQVVAVTLAMNASNGYFISVAVDDVDRQKYFLELGLEDLGLSTCERFRLFGQTLCTLSPQTSSEG
uniref:protein O-GlcNAcase n=1 Tax=Caenorhabditis japonica TaxID=281687 RepID=A0A8R1HWC5_CAEJA